VKNTLQRGWKAFETDVDSPVVGDHCSRPNEKTPPKTPPPPKKAWSLWKKLLSQPANCCKACAKEKTKKESNKSRSAPFVTDDLASLSSEMSFGNWPGPAITEKGNKKGSLYPKKKVIIFLMDTRYPSWNTDQGVLCHREIKRTFKKKRYHFFCCPPWDLFCCLCVFWKKEKKTNKTKSTKSHSESKRKSWQKPNRRNKKTALESIFLFATASSSKSEKIQWTRFWVKAFDSGTRKLVIYTWRRRSHGKLWWKSAALLTCKSRCHSLA